MAGVKNGEKCLNFAHGFQFDALLERPALELT